MKAGGVPEVPPLGSSCSTSAMIGADGAATGSSMAEIRRMSEMTTNRGCLTISVPNVSVHAEVRGSAALPLDNRFYCARHPSAGIAGSVLCENVPR